MSAWTLKDATEALTFLGIYMEMRHNSQDVEAPIQTWNIPEKEKGFFTVYAMNIVMESDGFENLVEQKSEDVEAFIDLLQKLGAKKTSAFVRSTISEWKGKVPRDERTSEYYRLFRQEKVPVKLLDYLGQRIYASYFQHSEKIHKSGENIFDVKQWNVELP